MTGISLIICLSFHETMICWLEYSLLTGFVSSSSINVNRTFCIFFRLAVCRPISSAHTLHKGYSCGETSKCHNLAGQIIGQQQIEKLTTDNLDTHLCHAVINDWKAIQSQRLGDCITLQFNCTYTALAWAHRWASDSYKLSDRNDFADNKHRPCWTTGPVAVFDEKSGEVHIRISRRLHSHGSLVEITSESRMRESKFV